MDGKCNFTVAIIGFITNGPVYIEIYLSSKMFPDEDWRAVVVPPQLSSNSDSHHSLPTSPASSSGEEGFPWRSTERSLLCLPLGPGPVLIVTYNVKRATHKNNNPPRTQSPPILFQRLLNGL